MGGIVQTDQQKHIFILEVVPKSIYTRYKRSSE